MEIFSLVDRFFLFFFDQDQDQDSLLVNMFF